MGIKHYEEKIPTQLESNPRFSHLEADVGPLRHRVAVALSHCENKLSLIPKLYHDISSNAEEDHTR